MDPNERKGLCLFLCGDVMTGRGIDQVLPYPGEPSWYDSSGHDARYYVDLAEKASGPLQKPVSFEYIWGDSLSELDRARPDLRIINLETSITSNNEPWPDKTIHYRMHPRNIGCLTAAHISACAVANNHILDWGYAGLMETLQTLRGAGLAFAGAGRNAEEAAAPAVLELPGKGRVLLSCLASSTSGIPAQWSATRDRAGINLVDLSESTAARVAKQMRERLQPGDVIVASIHWGGNWGYEIPDEQILFAHRLIEEGVAIVHGHSSHHVKGIEVYRDRLILYGCGDFLTDYEGLTRRRRQMFRGDLSLMYLPEVDPRDGRLVALRMVPMQMRRFQVTRASTADTAWLCDLLNRLGKPLGTGIELAEDTRLKLA